MIENDEQLLFVRYWAKRIELDALAAGEGILVHLLSAHMRRALVDAAFPIAAELRRQILDYERRTSHGR